MTGRILLADIQAVVAAEYRLTVRDLVGPCVQRHVSGPRQIAMAIAARLTKLTKRKIGHLFGGRDHTTVKYAIDQVKERGILLVPLEHKIRAYADKRRLRIEAEAELAAFEAARAAQNPAEQAGSAAA